MWLTDLDKALAGAPYGLHEVPGWRTRGARGSAMRGKPQGSIFHETATSDRAPGDLPTLGLLVRGRSDLSGPLCHIGTGRSGRLYLVAAGRANHGGKSVIWTDANGVTIGNEVEAANLGRPLTPPQAHAVRWAHARLTQWYGYSVGQNRGHRESAPTRKSDPRSTPDLASWRRSLLSEEAAPEAEEDEDVFKRGDSGWRVRFWVQGTLNKVNELEGHPDLKLVEDADYGPTTEKVVEQTLARYGAPTNTYGPVEHAILANVLENHRRERERAELHAGLLAQLSREVEVGSVDPALLAATVAERLEVRPR